MDRDNTDNKKLKIVMLDRERVPSKEDGIEIVVEKLASRMVAKGYNVTCYSRRGHHASGAEFDGKQLSEYRGIKIKTVPTISRKGLMAMTSSSFVAVKATLGHYDTIHTHAEGPVATCWIPKLCGKVVVVTIHGLDWRGEKWKGGFGSKYIKFNEKCTVKFADQIIVLSEDVRSYFMDTCGGKAAFIPNSVSRPVKREPNEIRKRWGLEKDSYILFLGRLVPEKGLRYLVGVCKGLETYKKLVIVGGGPDTSALTKELKQPCAGLEDSVISAGFIQGKTLDELYGNCYLYVLPSDLEGMSLSLLEATNYRNYCVVSDIGECKSVITGTDGNQNVAVFRKSGVEDLTGKLRTLLNNGALVQGYKDEAAGYIYEEYGWNKVVEKTVGVCRKAGARR